MKAAQSPALLRIQSFPDLLPHTSQNQAVFSGLQRGKGCHIQQEREKSNFSFLFLLPITKVGAY